MSTIRQRSRTLWIAVCVTAVIMIAPSAIGQTGDVSALLTLGGLGFFFGALALVRMLRFPTCGSPAWAKSLQVALARCGQRVECQHCSADLK